MNDTNIDGSLNSLKFKDLKHLEQRTTKLQRVSNKNPPYTVLCESLRPLKCLGDNLLVSVCSVSSYRSRQTDDDQISA